ncbi:diaminobutyrate--2-oxoglutarate transaminase [Paenibacillus ferrarius]|uniref:Diaminobutyrate--2-oxoglutarate transaminase n=1 Tax=Paenibacillus ferrarius TaxID=1469647 RepID=A0A1V4H9J2_9BACL|nr:diaminobutyrate--2-oxoglutarate transaminase [Paenibacillus ferrarius]OPH47995.1 diaminobutyrate--2-oxoglutarate transaminase [Paenibacillus ferrarius]
MSIVDEFESNVRYYSRAFPDLFTQAQGSIMYSKRGKEYIDFFAGAGALNYGHNNAYIKEALIRYIQSNGITHALDMSTEAKETFIATFHKLQLLPHSLDYVFQFCGPSGTNAVEAAIKLARKATGRTGIFSFMGGFHGVTLGSLSVTSNAFHRNAAFLPSSHVTFIPYCDGIYGGFDSITYMENILNDTHSGIDKPAAIILETIQAEGGIYVSSKAWLQDLERFCRRHGILLICDDIQVGCGRVGEFFSFKEAGIVPDIVALSKSISGYGLPMSLLLYSRTLDHWLPGEHNGTFRGNQLAFVAAVAALEYRESANLKQQVQVKEMYLKKYLTERLSILAPDIAIRGRGAIWGIDLSALNDHNVAKKIASDCFENGLLIERVGRHDNVLKIMPPLNIEMELLEEGCRRLEQVMIQNLLSTSVRTF